MTTADEIRKATAEENFKECILAAVRAARYGDVSHERTAFLLLAIAYVEFAEVDPDAERPSREEWLEACSLAFDKIK